MLWENYRKDDGSLSLQVAFSELYAGEPANWLAVGLNYILQIEALCPIKSRQVAATIIVQAAELANIKYLN